MRQLNQSWFGFVRFSCLGFLRLSWIVRFGLPVPHPSDWLEILIPEMNYCGMRDVNSTHSCCMAFSGSVN